MRKLSLLVIVAALLFVGVVPSRAQDSGKTIAELAAGNKDLSTLFAAVGAADPAFATLLSDKTASLTVFAPTNAAFEALLKALNMKAEDLLKNKALLNVVLAYHVVPGVYDAAAVTKLNDGFIGTALPDSGNATKGGLPRNALAVKVAGGKVKIGDATVVTADVKASNGIVHVIDAVLVPADVTDIVKMETDMMAMTPAATMDAGMAAPVSIAETVVAATKGKTPEFTTLLAAVAAADPMILATLTKGGPFTVFAPTDAAFTAALKALKTTPEKLLADKATLTKILAYHVIPGEFKAATVIAATKGGAANFATELAGTTLKISQKDGSVYINDAKVVATDVEATNGIIHVIDGVLLPPTK